VVNEGQSSGLTNLRKTTHIDAVEKRQLGEAGSSRSDMVASPESATIGPL